MLAAPHLSHAVSRGRGELSPGGQNGLDLLLQLLGEFAPIRTEEFDPIVGHRVVGGGDHSSSNGPGLPGGVGHPRSWQHAAVDDVDADGHQPGSQRAANELAGDAGIAAEHQRRSRSPVSEDVAGGAAQSQGKVCGQIAVGEPADTVRSKPGVFVGHHKLCPHVFRRDQRGRVGFAGRSGTEKMPPAVGRC